MAPCLRSVEFSQIIVDAIFEIFREVMDCMPIL